MRFSAHLTFNGNCSEAFRFYAATFGAKLPTLMTWGSSPAASHVPPELADKIIHATLVLDGGELLGADVPDFKPAQGFFVLYRAPSVAEAERVFAALSEGGTVGMPMQKTFWTPTFGVCTDRFGTPWEITA